MSKRSAEEIIQAVERYNTFEPEGFQHTKNQQYSSELKQAAVRDYLNGVGSQINICKKYKIRTSTLLQNWIKVYNSHKELRPS